MVEEKVFADSIKKCYTYDSVGRVIETVVKNISDDSAIEKETFNYDAAGNITDAPDSCFQYDTNNRLVVFNGNAVSYDLDGNMLSDGVRCFTYDSTNKLITADGHTYTYNAEGVRIRNLCECGEETTYTYNTNCKLSQLLMKTTDGVVTKYVYGKGLIGEEVENAFKTYHFDFRGSTIAITDASGAIMDTFAYDTYGKCISRTGTSDVIFGYNGRDGVVTDSNGLIYMRARYYSPEMKRFINADIVAGSIANAVTLNRFAYANGNPVSFVDPFGLSVKDALEGIADYLNIPEDRQKCAVASKEEIVSAIYDNSDEAFEALKKGYFVHFCVNEFKSLTREGKLDNSIDLFLVATKDQDGIYHIDQNYWQSIDFVGYNDLYDKAFDFGVGLTGYTVDNKKFPFTYKGKEYVIWMWKGDYINLGAGAEVGIYKEDKIPGHYFTSVENSMPMSLKLQQIDTGKVLFDYHPAEKQWWINGFAPSTQRVFEENLQLSVTIDFSSNPGMYEAFKEIWGTSDWIFYDNKAIFNWKK